MPQRVTGNGLHIRLSPDVKSKLMRLAFVEKTTASAIVTNLLTRAISEHRAGCHRDACVACAEKDPR